MGLVQSWLWPNEARQPVIEVPANSTEVLAAAVRRRWWLPQEVRENIKSYLSVEGTMVDAIVLPERVNHMAAEGDVLVIASDTELKTWVRYVPHSSLRVECFSLATWDGIVWTGHPTGQISLFSLDLSLRRYTLAHRRPVTAIVLSSDRSCMLSFSQLDEQMMKVWDKQGLPLRMVRCASRVLERCTLSLHAGELRLWDGAELQLQADAAGAEVESQAGMVSAFVDAEAGGRLLVRRDVAVDAHCSVALRAGRVYVCDPTGRPRGADGAGSPWALLTRTSPPVTAMCRYGEHLVLTTSDKVLYVFK